MPNDKTKTGQGVITEVSEVQTHGDSGREFKVVNLGKRKLSCWKPELFGELVEGASIDFEYTTSKDGKYHNIVSLKSDTNGSRTSGNGQLTKDELIVRQTCIKVAGPMMGVNADTPAEKAAEVIAIADLLEEWVWAKKSTEPEPPPEEGE